MRLEILSTISARPFIPARGATRTWNFWGPFRDQRRRHAFIRQVLPTVLLRFSSFYNRHRGLKNSPRVEGALKGLLRPGKIAVKHSLRVSFYFMSPFMDTRVTTDAFNDQLSY